MLEVRGLAMTFGKGETRVGALAGVDLEVRRGEFLAVTGASGSGKSTLLHLLAGLAHPTAGRVTIDGVALADLDDDDLTRMRRRRIGIVFQSFNLLPVLTAVENVALPLAVDGVPRATAEERARRSLERVGVAHRAAHRPSEMSGGEQQRVAIARALVAEPVIVLADEPTGNLDSRHGEQVIALLRGLCDEGGRTILMVTHDERHARAADRVLRLLDGRIVSETRPGEDPAGDAPAAGLR